MASTAATALLLAGVAGAWFFWWQRRARRLRHIRQAPLPPGVYEALRAHRPDIAPAQFPLISRALRDFYAAYLLGGRRPLSMPSQAADALWHECILHTRHYERFCRKAFGRFLHHTPAVVLSTHYDRNVGLRRAWWQACKLEGIDPRRPARLPLLFALDATLGLRDGYRYALDCRGLREQGDSGGGTQCASDMGDTSFDGTTDGFGDGEGSTGDGGGGDGCSGGGCGGD